MFDDDGDGKVGGQIQVRTHLAGTQHQLATLHCLSGPASGMPMPLMHLCLMAMSSAKCELHATPDMHGAHAADDDIIAKLPCWTPPASYAECVTTGRYGLFGCSAEDRDAGEYHSASVLHVPSKMPRALW